MAITRRQKEVIDFLTGFTQKNGYSPSYEEIASGLGLTSLATVHKHVSNLQNKGLFRGRIIGAARSMCLRSIATYLPPSLRSVTVIVCGMNASSTPGSACARAGSVDPTSASTASEPKDIGALAPLFCWQMPKLNCQAAGRVPQRFRAEKDWSRSSDFFLAYALKPDRGFRPSHFHPPRGHRKCPVRSPFRDSLSLPNRGAANRAAPKLPANSG